jgi:hypothetical protein
MKFISEKGIRDEGATYIGECLSKLQNLTILNLKIGYI